MTEQIMAACVHAWGAAAVHRTTDVVVLCTVSSGVRRTLKRLIPSPLVAAVP
jgi:hypothetical protein